MLALIVGFVLISWLSFNLTDSFGGIRVSQEEETQGLDVGEHGMEAYPDFASSK